MALSLLDQFGGSQAAAQKQLGTATQDAQKAKNSFSQFKSSNRPSGLTFDDSYWKKYNKLSMDANQAANSQLQAQNNVTAQDPSQNPAAAFQRILGTSEDFYNQASGSNAMDQMLQQELMKRVRGGGPYDATTINALKTGANEQAAAAEAANNQAAMQSLEARGFKPGDPAYQAALSRNREQRQKSNQAAGLNIAQQANVANYNAQGQNLSQMQGYNTDQQSRQLAAMQNLQRNYNQVSAKDFGSGYNLPNYLSLMKKG